MEQVKKKKIKNRGGNLYLKGEQVWLEASLVKKINMLIYMHKKVCGSFNETNEDKKSIKPFNNVPIFVADTPTLDIIKDERERSLFADRCQTLVNHLSQVFNFVNDDKCIVFDQLIHDGYLFRSTDDKYDPFTWTSDDVVDMIVDIIDADIDIKFTYLWL